MLNGKKKDKYKRIINGIIKSVRFFDIVGKDLEDMKDVCLELKKIKIEYEVIM